MDVFPAHVRHMCRRAIGKSGKEGVTDRMPAGRVSSAGMAGTGGPAAAASIVEEAFKHCQVQEHTHTHTQRSRKRSAL